ncbi:MAG: N-acetylmuramoyl-L-alanine amidase [bacterium]|nr:N-acetylmuramoyl-L-alanine amidase [bacterium]
MKRKSLKVAFSWAFALALAISLFALVACSGSGGNSGIEQLTFARNSADSLTLSWVDSTDSGSEAYTVIRRCTDQEDAQWNVVGSIESNGAADGKAVEFTDKLPSSDPIIYEYRVIPKGASDVEELVAKDRVDSAPGASIYASSILICLDPGHYAGCNDVPDGEYPYCEGDVMLDLAKALQEDLLGYGITCKLTRDSGSITLGGLTDADLDSANPALRGEQAEGCNLFISLHTGSNQENVNRHETYDQPIGITKTIVLMNKQAVKDPYAIAVGNEIGKRVTATNYEHGYASLEEFGAAESFADMTAWTDEFNDALHTKGTLCYSNKGDARDYGVLEGADSIGVSGMVIEHAFHTVPVMRKAFNKEDLVAEWAACDAEGIAVGFGFLIEED